jgi:ABC-type nickel/cobalt efflux system permease component RcnA
MDGLGATWMRLTAALLLCLAVFAAPISSAAACGADDPAVHAQAAHTQAESHGDAHHHDHDHPDDQDGHSPCAHGHCHHLHMARLDGLEAQRAIPSPPFGHETPSNDPRAPSLADPMKHPPRA